MRPKMHQLGILPEFDGEKPADYSGTVVNPLNRQVWCAVHDAGIGGATVREVAAKLGKTEKSIAGRITELHSIGHLLVTEAKRDGQTVYVSVGAKL